MEIKGGSRSRVLIFIWLNTSEEKKRSGQKLKKDDFIRYQVKA